MDVDGCVGWWFRAGAGVDVEWLRERRMLFDVIDGALGVLGVERSDAAESERRIAELERDLARAKGGRDGD